ncbi:MAG: FHA domain-containing protein [bacterium]|nr:FHA domain-containing protein [bacterium]
MALTLAIEGNGGSELTYELSKSSVSIGASSQNDVVIRSPGVAPQHLTIQDNGKVFTFIVAQRQVVVLNGERRSRGVLKVGDRIRIGSAAIVFKGVGESEVVVEPSAESSGSTSAGEVVPAAASSQPQPGKTRSKAEILLYCEPSRLAEARQKMVEIFRAGIPSDLVPPLRTFFDEFFSDRQALLAGLSDDGRFEPIASQWTGELPRLPPRTYEELGSIGRYAVLRLAGREILIYPVEYGGLHRPAFILVETTVEERDDDEVLLAELARMLAVHWERVESSSSLYGPWETAARKQIAECLPGTSQAVQVLRDSVLETSRSAFPALICGREGSGRMWMAKLISGLHPTGELTVNMVQCAEDADERMRIELFGGSGADASSRLVERARGQVVVIRGVHKLSETVQRELAATIRHDLEAGYGPAIRWLATTTQDCLGLLNDGDLDATLFHLFQRHTIHIPSLENRREDLPLLIVRLLERVGAEQGKEIRGIELETLNSLLRHPFPGEMVELLAELRRLVSATPDREMVRGLVPVGQMSSDGLGHSSAAPDVAGLLAQDDMKIVIPAVERLVIERVLQQTLGNQSKAARRLNLSRGALIAKMKEYKIPDYRYLRRSRR